MKKRFLIACAICVLFLSACGSRVETSTSATHTSAHATRSVTTASTQNVCQGLHDQQTQLSQQYQAASVQLSEAQAGGNLQHVREAEKRPIRLQQSLAQVQAQLKACYQNVG